MSSPKADEASSGEESHPRDTLAYVRGIVDTVREPLVVLDARLRVRGANRSFYRTFGVSPRNTEGQLLYDLGSRQWDIPRLRTLLEEILPHDRAFDDFEVEHDFPDLGRKVMLLNARRLRQDDSELILLAIEDVTERRRAEAERRELETRFTSLVKSIKDHAIFTLDPAGRVTSWNIAAEHILGYTEAEVLGRDFAIIFTPEDRQQGVPEAELRAAREHGRAEDERWHLRKGGERFWALGIVSAVHDANGRLTGFSKILRDMTASKAAEQALRRSEERYRQIVESANSAVIRWRRDGTITFFNEYAQRFFGWPADEVIGRHIGILLPDADSSGANLKRLVDDVIRRPERYVSNVNENVCRDGRRVWMTWTNRAIRDAAGEVTELLAVGNDISAQKRAEEALREANRRKDAFLAILAHELRNPLAPLRTSLDLLQALRGDAAACEASLGIMDRQLNHLVRLVDDLLDVSRISRGKIRLRREALDLADIIDAAMEMSANGLAVDERCLSVNVPSRPLPVEGDRVRLVQVVSNLLNNAARFTDRGGQIALRVLPRGDRVEIQVQDDGRGIPRERLEDIFDAFAQAEPGRGGGLGIGLALVRDLVAMHGGKVWADSAGPGRGSTFTVALPMSTADPAAPPQPRAAAEPDPLPQRRVLVVDDNHDVAESLCLLITMLEAEARVAHSGAQALRICADWRPNLVLMDLGMPGMDGYEAARRMCADHPDRAFRLVALSGWGGEDHRQQARDAGFDQHLVKPVGLAELKEVLSRCSE